MIDARAIIDPAAKIDIGVSVGPFSIIGPDVEIGKGSWIGPHVVINGPTKIGTNNRIYQFCSLGEISQDKKAREDEKTILEIGNNNTIREYCTMHRGTKLGGGVTRLGDDNWIMAYAHLAHDCLVGNDNVLANAASLAGHVVVGDQVILGGFAKVHQFCQIGDHSFAGLGSTILKDIPPYVMVSGNPAKPYGINVEGLKRRGFSGDSIKAVRKAYKIIYKQKRTLKNALEELKSQLADANEVQVLIEFLEASTRSIVR